jgi:para-nitrobenzyl esterase
VNITMGSEDCLFLNVFAPATPPTTPRPVMVWIHGGGFDVGSGMDDDPSRVAAASGDVMVTMNYRLGPFGFLALPQLGAAANDHSEGNAGILDQQAALKWVKANAAAFGGDAGNVTIYGESAGGISVCAQLLSPTATGLFEKAITESGPCDIPIPPKTTSEAQGAKLAGILGCSDPTTVVTCLQSKPAPDVLGALPSDPTFVFGQGASWFPTADGVVVPTDPVAALQAGKFPHIPIIVGANRDEGRLFSALAYSASGKTLGAADWAPAVEKFFGPTVGPQVEAKYPLADYPDPSAALGQAVGDAILACPAVESATLLSKYTTVYEYEFDHTPNQFVLPTPGTDLGAMHSAELPYVFDGPVESTGPLTFSPADQQLATTVSTAWTRFAATGNPAGGGLTWPALGAGGNYLSLDTPSTSVLTGMKQFTCAFWAQSGWSLASLPGR